MYNIIKKQMIDTLPFARLLGIQIDELGPDGSRVSMPEDPKLNNHLGSHHAGATFTLAETASGAAMVGGFAGLISTLRPVVKEARIQYLQITKGASHAIGKIPGDLAALKQALASDGKIDFVVEVDVLDAQDTLVAQAQVDWYLSMKR